MDNNVKHVQLNVIREQGEYMDPVPLSAEESATVASRDNTPKDEE